MVLDTATIFPTSKEGADEFFVQEAEEALRPRQAIKSADETVTGDETVQDDDEIFMSVSAGRTYKFEAYIYITLQSDLAAPGFRYTFKGPTGSTGKFWTILDYDILETGYDPLPLETEKTTYDNNKTDGWFHMKGWIKTGNTAGNLNFRWALREDAGAEWTKVMTGSWLEVTRQ